MCAATDHDESLAPGSLTAGAVKKASIDQLYLITDY